ncbi:hypothetical protein BHM03_00040563 [Ensete ventricosum]|uniref:Uncharacterized protein n=1 Tax=Ensete ventricosum TaxID=4639 RepID=A0A427AEZ6_ENSVE|nr:hypothetical protein B296_00029455 [Ensete ventricosum]RZS09482.1 hypothetical protein BHM03_00040563 [Ensete ventricosum]
MEHAKAIAASPSSSSPPREALANPEAESQISAILFDTWQQVQEAMQSMLKMTRGALFCVLLDMLVKTFNSNSEIEQSSAEIKEEIEKCKERVEVRSKALEEAKEHMQKTAIAVLQIFNGPEVI